MIKVPSNDYFHGVNLSPKEVDSTPVYLLGSSDGSSVLAGQLGAGFLFGT